MQLVEARDALAATRDAQAAAEAVDREAHDGPSAAAQLRAQSALRVAEREWARAVARWLEAADELSEQLPAGSKRDELRKSRDVVAAYDEELSTVTDLERLLELAEEGTGHVFRAVGLRMRKQVTDLLGTSRPGAVVAVLTVFVLVSTVAGIVLVATNESFSWILIVLSVVVVLTAMNVLVARVTDKFAWYGISVFFSVLMFGGALTIARTLDEPKVQPVALVRKGDEVGICGVFVTQTSERVYVGRLALEGASGGANRPGLLFWVPTSDVELVSVGEPERIGPQFPKLAVAQLARLYGDRAEEAAPALKNTTVSTSSGGPSPATSTTTTSETPPATARPRRHPHVKIYEQSCTATQHVDP